jgi:hypothetical protein
LWHSDPQILPENPSSLPESATFYLLKDALELGGESAVPCPNDPYPQYPAYSVVDLSGIYLVDNTGMSGESIQEIVSPLKITPDDLSATRKNAG